MVFPANPYEEIVRMRRSIDRLFETFGGFEEATGIRTPLIDIMDAKNEVVILAEVPGTKKEELSIQANEAVLTIQTERKEEKDEKLYYYSERKAAQFFRNIALPEDVDPNSVKAKLENGLLKVRLKKVKRKLRTKTVKIE